MYGNAMVGGSSVPEVQDSFFNKTVGENLDMKISRLQAEIERLKSAKESLGPLLNMKIGDIRSAMDY